MCWGPTSVPEECFMSVQGAYSPFASPMAQRYAGMDELHSDDSEDTAVMTPTKNPQAMPTVDEDLSQELPPSRMRTSGRQKVQLASCGPNACNDAQLQTVL